MLYVHLQVGTIKSLPVPNCLHTLYKSYGFSPDLIETINEYQCGKADFVGKKQVLLLCVKYSW